MPGSGGGALELDLPAQTFNDATMLLRAAPEGFGLAYLPEDMVRAHIDEGRLVRVLERLCDRFPGYHPYYPSRRQHSPAFALMVDVLRYRP